MKSFQKRVLELFVLTQSCADSHGSLLSEVCPNSNGTDFIKDNLATWASVMHTLKTWIADDVPRWTLHCLLQNQSCHIASYSSFINLGRVINKKAAVFWCMTKMKCESIEQHYSTRFCQTAWKFKETYQKLKKSYWDQALSHFPVAQILYSRVGNCWSEPYARRLITATTAEGMEDGKGTGW